MIQHKHNFTVSTVCNCPYNHGVYFNNSLMLSEKSTKGY